MLTVEAIQDKVFDFMRSRVPVAELEVWLVAHSWGSCGATPEAVGLAYDIELLLAESSSGHLADDELRDGLLRLCAITTMPVSIRVSEDWLPHPSTHSSSSISRSPIQWVSAGTQLSLAVS